MFGSNLLIATAIGGGAALATPVVLSLAGFGAGGVVAGSVAASIQGPATVAGSTFALSQSAGVLGSAVTTKLGVVAITGGSSYLVSKATELKK